jgi:hypothetical protein
VNFKKMLKMFLILQKLPASIYLLAVHIITDESINTCKSNTYLTNICQRIISLNFVSRLIIRPDYTKSGKKERERSQARDFKESVHSFGRLVSNWQGSNLQIRDSFEIEVDI